MKKIFYFAFYNFIVLLFLILLSELLVRQFNKSQTTQGTTKQILADSLYYDSPGLKPLSIGKSNGATVIVDDYGFRKCNKNISKESKSWLLIGDSVTMGIGIDSDSTYAALIQSAVKSHILCKFLPYLITV